MAKKQYNYAAIVRSIARETNVTLDDSEVLRLAGTLRFAGIDTAELARSIVQRHLQADADAVVSAEVNKEGATFQKIDAALTEGTCPLCNKQLRDVKLADYTEAKFCTQGCNVVLW